MAEASPSKFTKTDDAEMEQLRQELQLHSYSCNDEAVPRRQLYEQSVGVHGRVCHKIAKEIRLRRAAEMKLRMEQQQKHQLQLQLLHAQQQIKELQEQLEVERACACFIKD
eukprot:superscaffoldBa00016196_g26796